MTTLTTPHFIAIFFIIAFLIALNGWLHAESRINWYIKKYHSEPRVKPCPLKRGRFNRLVLALFTFPTLHQYEKRY